MLTVNSFSWKLELFAATLRFWVGFSKQQQQHKLQIFRPTFHPFGSTHFHFPLSFAHFLVFQQCPVQIDRAVTLYA